MDHFQVEALKLISSFLGQVVVPIGERLIAGNMHMSEADKELRVELDLLKAKLDSIDTTKSVTDKAADEILETK